MLALSLMASPSFASIGGGKKKAKKKAKIECTKDKCCDVKNCDVKNCDPKSCDPKNCNYTVSAKEEKCNPAIACSGNQ